MNNTIFTTFLFEVRYEPIPSILDKRGEITSALSSEILKHWNIGTNRIDFFNEQNKNVSAFFSYKNLGLQSSHPNNQSFFVNNSKELLKSSWPFFSNNIITRIGVKSIFILDSDNFKDLFDKYVEKFLGLKKEDIEKFGGTLIDVGFPLDFIDGDNYFSVSTGPMEKKDYDKNVSGLKDFPEASMLVEVDYYRNGPIRHINRDSIVKIIENGIKKGRDVSNTIVKILN